MFITGVGGLGFRAVGGGIVGGSGVISSVGLVVTSSTFAGASVDMRGGVT